MVQLSQNPIGQSPAWLASLDRISDLAAADIPLIISGERGTGKSLVAERLHFLSPRWEENFAGFDCTAYADNDLEKLLFGLRSYQEAVITKLDGGTLFLANIDGATRQLQAALLYIIERGQYISAGGEKPDINVRIIASSSKPLKTMAADGMFSGRLLHALTVDVLTLPPLRTRGKDVYLLAEYFANNKAKQLGESGFGGFSAEALQQIFAYKWPGNIRELKAAIERAVINAWNDEAGREGIFSITNIETDPFKSPWLVEPGYGETEKPGTPPIISGKISAKTTKTKADFKSRSAEFEKTMLKEALRLSKNHQGKAAEYLGLSYHQFRRLLAKYRLEL